MLHDKFTFFAYNSSIHSKEYYMKKLFYGLMIAFTSSLFAADGASLYKTCVTCHGAKAEKSALNKSQVIAGWSSENTIAALSGYKDGTYGGSMKSTMNAQVKNLDDAAITALAKYIETLK